MAGRAEEAESGVGGADRLAQLDGIIVGMMVAERGFGVPIEILTVNERHGVLHARFQAHGSHYRRGDEITPPGALPAPSAAEADSLFVLKPDSSICC